MRFSPYNILHSIRDSKDYYIINLLSGNADILEEKDREAINNYLDGKIIDPEFLNEMTGKGYIASEQEEKSVYISKYLDFVDNRDKDEIQIFFVPSYSCNFSCSYCYQNEYDYPKDKCTNEVIDAFFNYVKTEFAYREKYVTLFGGEPLTDSHGRRELIGYFLEKAEAEGIEVSIVTNAYYLEEYTSVFKPSVVREVQVTLDGMPEMHNKRRPLKGGGGTFDKIVNGIDACLAKSIPVNLRIVVDKENITELPFLAAYAVSKGWTGNPLFKTQLGRNYELHTCQADSGKLFDRLGLYESIYELAKTNPQILEFHKPAFSVAKFLSENGVLPEPLFDACPACKTEWAFDYTGSIYSCTATVGKADEKLGTFYPEISLLKDIVEEWESRDVTVIPECKVCNLQLACGGGCGSIAKNKTGKICSPDCRPVKELLGIGLSLYKDDLS